MITEEQIKLFAPAAQASLIPIVTKWFNNYADEYEVNTPARIAAFFAQVIHESGSFKYTREIASGSAYEFRADLGNLHAGDGKKFKGRGYIQITGRNNYNAISKDLFSDNRLIDNPDLLATPQYAMLSAFWYWSKHDLNKYADMKVDDKIHTKHHGYVSPFEFITLIINGGFNGLQERVHNYNRICILLDLPTWKPVA
jgi:putative chitinase